MLRARRGRAKDQSYVLYMLGRDELARVRLPVGELTKAEVREHAHRLGLRTADKPESMDVCFITKGGKDAFLGRAHRACARARSSRRTVTVVGDAHRRRRVHRRSAARARRRARGAAVRRRRRCAARSTVTIGDREDLLRDELRRARPDCSPSSPAADEAVLVQVRAHGEPFLGRWHGDRVVCASPQPRVSPGQVVALYRGDVLLGGGIAAASDRACTRRLADSGR